MYKNMDYFLFCMKLFSFKLIYIDVLIEGKMNVLFCFEYRFVGLCLCSSSCDVVFGYLYSN